MSFSRVNTFFKILCWLTFLLSVSASTGVPVTFSTRGFGGPLQVDVLCLLPFPTWVLCLFSDPFLLFGREQVFAQVCLYSIVHIKLPQTQCLTV